MRPIIVKGVPKFFETLCDAARAVQDYRLLVLGGRVDVLICGAGALDAPVTAFFKTRCVNSKGGKLTFVEGYGATECGNIASNRRICAHVQWRLLPVEGMADDCGQLAVKTGAMMFSGYYRDAARTAKAFTDDGYYLTGDNVRISSDDDGWPLVDVLGRSKTTTKLKTGKWVHKESLEDFYRQVARSTFLTLTLTLTLTLALTSAS